MSLNLADKAPLVDYLSTAITGEPGAGKTTLCKLLSYQMPISSGTAVVAHDLDTDFQDLFAGLGLDVIRVRRRDSDARWNLFLDVEHEDDYYDIASAMMGSSGSGENADFFHDSATQILDAILTKIHRDGREDGKQPNHSDIKGMTLDLDPDELHAALQGDFPAVASHIAGDGKQAQGVYSTLIKSLKPILSGDFGEAGSFSLRDYVKNPNGRVLIVDSDVDKLKSTGPMYRLLLDMSIQYAMTEPEATTNFILDEADALPPIPMLSTLASKGRSRDARCIIGIQTKGQLKQKYGRDTSIIGNCPQEVHMSPGDDSTIRHVRNAVGERMTTEITHSTSTTDHGTTTTASESRRERNPVSEGALNDFETGDAVIINQSSWWMGHIAEFSRVRNRLTCGVDTASLGSGGGSDGGSGGGSGPGGPGGSGGSSTPPSDRDEQEPEQEPPAPVRDAEHPAQSDGWLRRVTGLRSEDTGLTPLGRRLYGEGGERR